MVDDLNETIRYNLYLAKLGSYPLLDSLFYYLILPLGIIGSVLNLISFVGFLKINLRQSALKQYLIIYTLCSFFVCCIIIWFSFSRLPVHFDFAISYPMGFCRCKFISVAITLNFMNNVLDCIILLERVSNFNGNYKKIFEINPYLICVGVFLLTSFVNSPHFFVFDVRAEQEFGLFLKNVTLLMSPSFESYCIKNTLFKTLTGNIILYMVTLVRDVVMILIEITMSIYSIYMFKKYLSQHLNQNQLNMDLMNSNKTNITITLDQMITNQSNQGSNSTPTNFVIKSKVLIKVENFNTKLTKMTIYLSSCSIFSHFGLLVIYISYGTDYASEWSHYMTLLTALLVELKYISNFFFFIYFNKSFRISLANVFVSCVSFYHLASSCVSFLFNLILD